MMLTTSTGCHPALRSQHVLLVRIIWLSYMRDVSDNSIIEPSSAADVSTIVSLDDIRP